MDRFRVDLIAATPNPQQCIYADEGICQLLFFEGDPCSTTYSDRQGKYQHQPERVTLAKV